MWRNPVRNSEDEFSKTNYSDRVIRVGDKDKLDACATGLLVTIRQFSDAKWDRILGGAMAFADSRIGRKGAEPSKIIRPAIEVDEPFILSDASATSTAGSHDGDDSTGIQVDSYSEGTWTRSLSAGPEIVKEWQEEEGELDPRDLVLDDVEERE